MPKNTLICFWWLKSQNFKIIVECLSLDLKICVIKILVLMAIKLNNTESILKISSNELYFDAKVIDASLYWLSKIKVIVIIDEDRLIEREHYWIKYSDHEQDLRDLYCDCWVVFPNKKVLKFLKETPNDQCITYEALNNYLRLLKGVKKNTGNTKTIYFDEEFLNGHFKGTWREVLVQYELIEFWN